MTPISLVRANRPHFSKKLVNTCIIHIITRYLVCTKACTYTIEFTSELKYSRWKRCGPKNIFVILSNGGTQLVFPGTIIWVETKVSCMLGNMYKMAAPSKLPTEYSKSVTF